MALFNIEWKHSARKELKKLPKTMIAKVIGSVEELAKNPFPNGSRKIIGAEHTYRIRIGEYRILYSVESGKLVIVVLRIGHRKDIYKNLN